MQLFFVGCELGSYEDPPDPVRFENNEQEGIGDINFRGLNSITSIDDYTAKLNWTADTNLKEFQVYDVTDGGVTLVTKVDSSLSSYTVSGLESGQTYIFRVVGQYQDGREVSFITTDKTITTDSNPDRPYFILKTAPTYSIDIDSTPTFKIFGVRSGDTVKLFSDNCATEVGSVTASATTANVTSSELEEGTYNFYSMRVNPNGQSSACSSVFVSYQYQLCPSGYIKVPKRVDVGTDAFCVMKYEAKAWNISDSDGIVSSGEVVDEGCLESDCSTKNWGVGSYKPGSGENGNPWRMLDVENAKAECRSLGDNYDLISNKEWMSIARNIEEQDENWSGNNVGVGCVFRGNVGVDDACSYDNDGPDKGSSRDSKASHTLSNSEVIYDFAGNVFEWVDYGQEETITSLDSGCYEDEIAIELGQNFCSDVLDEADFFSNKPWTLTYDISGVIYDLAVDSQSKIYFATDDGLFISSSVSSATKITTLRGLSSNTLSGKIALDSNNNIYIGTQSGLNISTNGGSTFTVKKTSSGLGSNNVQDVFVDGDDNIYVATTGGLSISTDGGATFVNKTTTDGLGDNDCLSIYASSTGTNIYVGTAAGLSYSLDSGASFTNRTTADGLGSDTVQSISLDSSGNLYAGTSAGLSISTDSAVSFANRTTADGLGSDDIFDIFIDASDEVYVATASGFSYSTDSGTNFVNYTTADGLASNTVYSVIVNSDDVFLGTSNGSTHSDDFFTSDPINISFELKDNVYGMAIDSNSNKYFATDGGLTKSPSTIAFQSRSTLNGLASNDLTGKVAIDSSDNIYVGTQGGLNISEDSGVTFSLVTLEDGLGNNTVQDVFVNESDNLYVATTAGLSISADGGDNFTTKTSANSLGSDNILTVYANSTGTTIYVGTTAGFSYSTDSGATFTNRTTADGLGADRIQAIDVNSSGDVFVATSGGLSLSVDAGVSFSNITTANGLGNNNVYDVFIDSDDNVYAATANGLSYSTDAGASFTNYTTASGLVGNTCYSVFVDGDDIYIGTSNGLSITSNFSSYDNYNSSDGLGDQSTLGLGRLISGDGLALYRSGSYQGGEFSGIYNFSMASSLTSADDSIGFRCVYRP